MASSTPSTDATPVDTSVSSSQPSSYVDSTATSSHPPPPSSNTSHNQSEIIHANHLNNQSSSSPSTSTSTTPSAPVAAIQSNQSAAAMPPPSPPKSTLSSFITSTPSSIDALLTRLHRCLQTRAGADVVLLFLTYSTRLTGAILEDVARGALRRNARNLISLALTLPPSTTVTFTDKSVASPFAALALAISARLKAFAGVLTEVRTFGRLFGLLGLYLAAKKFVASRLSSSSSDSASKQDWAERTFDSVVSAAQIISLISFQATENLAYLGSKKILPITPATQGRLGLWSVRSWALYICMELGRLMIERQRRRVTTIKEKDVEWSAKWKKDVLGNLAWAPLTLHWSTPGGLGLNELAISSLAFYPACEAMKDLWRANA